MSEGREGKGGREKEGGKREEEKRGGKGRREREGRQRGRMDGGRHVHGYCNCYFAKERSRIVSLFFHLMLFLLFLTIFLFPPLPYPSFLTFFLVCVMDGMKFLLTFILFLLCVCVCVRQLT